MGKAADSRSRGAEQLAGRIAPALQGWQPWDTEGVPGLIVMLSTCSSYCFLLWNV